MKFRKDIQGLRAIAVLFVFIFHLSNTYLPGGFVGVDMFFVISGFLVTSIVYSKIKEKKFSILAFYKSRIKRIVPAYLIMLFITSIIVSIVFVNTDSYTFRKALFWTLLFGSNSHFASLDNYFGNSSFENPLLHTWTLGVEMQFYLVLPILLLLIKNTKVLIIFLLISVFVLLSYSTYGIFHGGTDLMYFSLLSRMPEFLIGSLAAIVNLENFPSIKKKANALSTLGAILVLLSAVLFSKDTPFPGFTSLIPCLGTLAILVSSSSKINSYLSNNILVFIGEISYSLYLWHWPVMALFRYYKNSYMFTPAEVIIVIILTLSTSLLSYYFVEKIFRQQKGMKFLIPFGTITGVVVAMVLLVPKINLKFNNLPLNFTSPSFGLESHGPTFVKVEHFGDISNQSHANETLFIGDSHALCMKKYLDILGKRNQFSFKTVTNNTYPTLPGLDKELFKEDRLYRQYNKLMTHINPEIPKSKLIILQFSDDGDKWQDGLKCLLKTMRADQRLIVLSDFPKLDKNPVRINRNITKNKLNETYIVTKRDVSKNILSIINSDTRAKFLDLSDSNVFDEAPFNRDTLMYYDQGHLNEYGAKKYAIDTEKKFMDSYKWGIN